MLHRAGYFRIEADLMLGSPAAVPGAKKLVVVEDDEDTRELEVFILTSEGYQVIGLPDGENAAETIQRESADLVILDLVLPGKHGLDVLAELENEPATANIPVIVVSAYIKRIGGRETLQRAPQVKRIFDKPFDITELLDAVSRELALAG